MSPVIEIDDEVMEELKKRAVALGLVFELPNATLRIVLGLKMGVKRRRSSGSGSYVSNPAKTADLLKQVGSHIMFKEITRVTIDKVERTLPSGMTFKEAWDYSNNGGWRNRVRMAILKEAGMI